MPVNASSVSADTKQDTGGPGSRFASSRLPFSGGVNFEVRVLILPQARGSDSTIVHGSPQVLR